MLLDRQSLSIHRAASTDATRQALNGILLEKDGRTVATNGHWLATVSPADLPEADFPSKGTEPLTPPDAGIILPTETAKAALKSIPKKTHFPILQAAQLCQNGNGPELLTTDLDNATHTSFHPVDSTYPNWRKSQPDDAETDLVVTFDARMLKAICETAIEFDHDNRGKVGITFRLPATAAKSVSKASVTSNGRRLDLLLMPIANVRG